MAPVVFSLGPFDLIPTGGPFDYLNERAAKLVIRSAFSRWLRHNPYRHWREYLEDWVLIERTETDVRTAGASEGQT